MSDLEHILGMLKSGEYVAIEIAELDDETRDVLGMLATISAVSRASKSLIDATDTLVLVCRALKKSERIREDGDLELEALIRTVVNLFNVQINIVTKGFKNITHQSLGGNPDLTMLAVQGESMRREILATLRKNRDEFFSEMRS